MNNYTLHKLSDDNFILCEVKEHFCIKPDMYYYKKYPREITKAKDNGWGAWEIIIASTNPIEGLPKLIFADGIGEKIGVIDENKLAENYVSSHPDFKSEGLSEFQNGKFLGFCDGYLQAKEDSKERKFTDKNILSAIYWGIHHWKARLENPTTEMIKEFISSINKTEWKVNIEINSNNCITVTEIIE